MEGEATSGLEEQSRIAFNIPKGLFKQSAQKLELYAIKNVFYLDHYILNTSLKMPNSLSFHEACLNIFIENVVKYL